MGLPELDEMMAPIDTAQLSTWMVQRWCRALETAIESMTSQRPSISFGPSGKEQLLLNGSVWWAQTYDQVATPALWVGTSPESWNLLSQIILSALGVPDASEDDRQSTARDLLAQAASGLAQDLTRGVDHEIGGGAVAQSDRPDWESLSVFEFAVDTGEHSLSGSLVLNGGFVSLLRNLAEQRQQESAGSKAPSGPGSGQPKRTFRSDLPVRIRVVLGRTSLPLRTIFKLSVGSVIELDRLFTDLAEIMIDDHRVGRGQIVVVNGNYGIQVTTKD